MDSDQDRSKPSQWDVDCSIASDYWPAKCPFNVSEPGICPLQCAPLSHCPLRPGSHSLCPRLAGPKPKWPNLSDPIIEQGMLSGPHIAYCIRKHGIIKNPDWRCLDTCTYHMGIGGKVLLWENGARRSFELSKCSDLNSLKYRSFELPSNSLAFVTTIESFGLTSDIIARFNLKSKYVHMGMLLGTGPIVDPEYSGNLMIPIHNFSDQPITLTYGEQLISVEFTKTLPPDAVIPASGVIRKYRRNKSSEFNFDDYQKKMQNKRVESSVAAALARHNEVIREAEKKISTFKLTGAAALIFGVIGSFSLVVACWDVIASVNQNSTNLREQIDREREAMKDVRERLEVQLKEMHLKLEKLESRARDAQVIPGDVCAN